jgi:anti-sigma factor RsiW
VNYSRELVCRELVELVTEYLEDALTGADRAAFERHVDECEDCSIHLDQMRQTIRMLGELAPERLSPSAGAALLAEFRSWARA